MLHDWKPYDREVCDALLLSKPRPKKSAITPKPSALLRSWLKNLSCKQAIKFRVFTHAGSSLRQEVAQRNLSRHMSLKRKWWGPQNVNSPSSSGRTRWSQKFAKRTQAPGLAGVCVSGEGRGGGGGEGPHGWIQN